MRAEIRNKTFSCDFVHFLYFVFNFICKALFSFRTLNLDLCFLSFSNILSYIKV